jgi:hypothetical protein
MIAEKRTSARLAFQAKANINTHDQSVEGIVQDVSMTGVFIAAPNQINSSETVAVTIYHTNVWNKKAKVVRVTDWGMGLQFETSLANLA